MPNRSWLSRIHWPFAGLGLGTPANLASWSPALRPRLGRTFLVAAVLGPTLVLLILALDHLFFSGDSLPRVRAIGAMPLADRFGIVVVSAIGEELLFRLGISTLVASLTYLALRMRSRRAAPASIGLGIAVAAVLFGLAHVGNAPNAAHPILRAVTLNGIAGVVFGWLYWYRGLEAALVAHFAADATLYLAVASLL